MSQQKIIDTLQNLGFSSLDAQVYLLLGKKGPKKVSELVQALKIPKQQLYAILKNLQSKGIINATLEHPARFSTEPFEKVLDLFVKARMEEIQQIQNSKSEILTDWHSIKIEEDKDKPSTFKVLEGNIYPKLKQMTEEVQTKLSIIFTITELIRIYQNEVLDEFLDKISTSSVNLRILTDVSSDNAKRLDSVFHKKHKNLEIKVPHLGLKLPNSMIIRDEAEVAFVIDSNENHQDKKPKTCLWTNCKTLVQSFNSIFETSWQNAIDIENNITKNENRKLTAKTCAIGKGDNNIFTEHKKALKRLSGFDYVIEPRTGPLTEKILKEKMVNGIKFHAKNPKKRSSPLWYTSECSYLSAKEPEFAKLSNLRFTEQQEIFIWR